MLSTSARDPFSTPCEKAIPEPYYPVITSSQFNSHHKYPVLVVSIGIQLQVSVTVGQAMHRLVLPSRGAPTYRPHLINSGRTHFPGSCPASAKQYAATRPRLNREVKHARLNLCPQGSWAHRPLHTCTLRGRPVSRPSYLPKKAGAYQSNPARAAPSLTSIKLQLMYTTQNAHTMPT